MDHTDRLLRLMKQAIELMREAREMRAQHELRMISDEEARAFLKTNAEQFNAVQKEIKEEMRK